MTSERLILRDIVKTFEMPTIDMNSTIKNAIERMIELNNYSLLVPRKNKNDAYGIITKKDIISKVLAEGENPSKVKVKDIMSKPLVILTNLSLDIRWVAKAMANSQVSTIAVFDRGDFYGYVTEACVLDGVYNAMRRAKLEQGVEFVSC
ncbi:MAG: CBS domain-containing protein [Thermoplasmata archaeon]|nr:CBS domain-containing protein [Thermoplasmata archaeon]MCJ7561867.1 CBS domain-containing protein [Thermoplasmata archaeon]TFG67797.1 MAG: CBS domain-containing protein [Methanomassiliicoccus sp.]